MNIALTLALGWSLVASSLAQTPSSPPTESAATPNWSGARGEGVVLPASVPDPIEPFNRVVYSINKGILIAVVKPTAQVYRFIVVKPIREGIGHFGRNITYPGRLINNLLQGKWSGARDETYGFFCNTTVGVAGFFDVAGKWKIPKSDADFGQTFGQWGWQPACYIMLPVFGPSSERDTLGLAADTAADPLTYIAPYPVNLANPLTYVSPYTYLSYGILYNNTSDTVDASVRAARSQLDAYSELQYAWTFVRKNRVADFQVTGKTDPASLETLQFAFLKFQDAKFPNLGKTRSVLIPTTGRKLKFNVWMQPQRAPVVYIVPGLGSHRLTDSTLALAELVYQQGFSAVCVSSTFNFEFMENAATTGLPGFAPVDVDDLRVALGEIDQQLGKAYPGQLGAKVLLGYSLGGFQSLFLAATGSTNPAPGISFDRYVAISSPVRLLYGLSQLDECYQAPLEWPAAERAANLENTFLKVAALSRHLPPPNTALPFSGIESRFLIGLSFRFTLRDAIFCSQQRDNRGVLEHQIRSWHRTAAYKEILGFSYQDYLRKLVIPYYSGRGTNLDTAENLDRAGSLLPFGTALHANQNVRLIVNRNDFLLGAADLAWFQTTFGEDRLTVFEQGGHLGNLAEPAVRKAILGALDGLCPAKSDSPRR